MSNNDNLLTLSDLPEKNNFWERQSRYISHEIKNQLSVINFYTKIIEKSVGNNKSLEETTTTIYNAVDSITNLLQDLKSVSTLKMDNYLLKNIIDNTLKTVEKILYKENISLKMDIDTPDIVTIDKQKFQNILINLIKNAVEVLKDTDKTEKYIKISTLKISDQILLRIENNGNKIEKKDQANIFNDGFTTKKNGSGIGLFLCKKQLSEMGCELSLLKSDKKQTVFQIIIRI